MFTFIYIGVFWPEYSNIYKGGILVDLTGKKIIIDPGHGGDFPGKTYKNRMEKDVTLKMSKILRRLLRDEGAKVYMTRTSDEDFGGRNADNDINKRVEYINEEFPSVDVLLSIHVNTERGRAGMFYPINGKASKTLAHNLVKKYGTFIASAGAWEADFAILRDTNRAGAKVLIELDQIHKNWLDDEEDLDRAAFLIVAGLYDYFREMRI
ncbi:N-acetylmuramoyl-L-alanine amidase [Brevibacillus laterosporus]|nr:N-acetylmuramoyl-L-alanine amidase [Brevibacillus laterosporus]